MERRTQWYLVELLIESERPRTPDICRRVSLQARSHQDAAERAEEALRLRWPELAGGLWCTTSEVLVCTDF